MRGSRHNINHVERLGNSVTIRPRPANSETAKLVHVNQRHTKTEATKEESTNEQVEKSTDEEN